MDQRIKEVQVWVCPEEDCSNFFGSSGERGKDLRQEFTGPMVENRGALEKATGSPMKHSRAECPDCRTRGKKVERVLKGARVSVDVDDPKTKKLMQTPQLPASMTEAMA